MLFNKACLSLILLLLQRSLNHYHCGQSHHPRLPSRLAWCESPRNVSVTNCVHSPSNSMLQTQLLVDARILMLRFNRDFPVIHCATFLPNFISSYYIYVLKFKTMFQSFSIYYIHVYYENHFIIYITCIK